MRVQRTNAKGISRTRGRRALARSRDVPGGTPIYELERGGDWATVPRTASAPVVRAFHAVLGRVPTFAELRLFFDIATTGTAEGGGVHAGKVEPVSP